MNSSLLLCVFLSIVRPVSCGTKQNKPDTSSSIHQKVNKYINQYPFTWPKIKTHWSENISFKSGLAKRAASKVTAIHNNNKTAAVTQTQEQNKVKTVNLQHVFQNKEAGRRSQMVEVKPHCGGLASLKSLGGGAISRTPVHILHFPEKWSR